MKTKTIKQTGFLIKGTAFLTCWDGYKGSIGMKAHFIPLDKATPKKILKCVNDNGFGCQSIDAADIDIYIQYDNGSYEYDRTLEISAPVHTQYFGKRGI